MGNLKDTKPGVSASSSKTLAHRKNSGKAEYRAATPMSQEVLREANRKWESLNNDSKQKTTKVKFADESKLTTIIRINEKEVSAFWRNVTFPMRRAVSPYSSSLCKLGFAKLSNEPISTAVVCHKSISCTNLLAPKSTETVAECNGEEKFKGNALKKCTEKARTKAKLSPKPGSSYPSLALQLSCSLKKRTKRILIKSMSERSLVQKAEAQPKRESGTIIGKKLTGPKTTDSLNNIEVLSTKKSLEMEKKADGENVSVLQKLEMEKSSEKSIAAESIFKYIPKSSPRFPKNTTDEFTDRLLRAYYKMEMVNKQKSHPKYVDVDAHKVYANGGKFIKDGSNGKTRPTTNNI